MQKAILIAAFVLISIFFITQLLLAEGFVGFDEFQHVSELRLYERDFLVFNNQDLCFGASAIGNVTILDSTFSEACINSSLLPTGFFDVIIANEDKKVWFSAEKRDEGAPSPSETIFRVHLADIVEQYETFNATIELTNGLNKGHVYIVSLQTGETIREIPIRLLPGETITKNEQLYLSEIGNNEITIMLDGVETDKKEILVTNNNIFSIPMLFIIGLVLIFLPSIILLRRDKDAIPLVFAFSLSILVLIPSFLNLFGLSLHLFVPALLIIILVMTIARRD